MGSEFVVNYITAGGLIASPMVAGAIAWGVAKARINEMRSAVSKLYEWKNQQTAMCANHMIEQATSKGQLSAKIDVLEEKLQEIIRQLNKIETIIDRRQRD
jgi:outer membrane murein-binding lipoprotein Lpp